jgi:hypothetical protein
MLVSFRQLSARIPTKDHECGHTSNPCAASPFCGASDRQIHRTGYLERRNISMVGDGRTELLCGRLFIRHTQNEVRRWGSDRFFVRRPST